MSVPIDELGGAVGKRLELRISAVSGAREQDLLVHAADTDRVGHLAEAMAEELREPTRLGLWCERRGEQLDGDLPLGLAAIRWGDRLLLVPPMREPTRVGGTARVELVVTGGPCAGERFELGDGSHRLGREPGVEVYISDPSLSRHHLDLVVKPTSVSAADAGSSNGTAVNGESLRPQRMRILRERDELELGRTLLRVQPLHAATDHGIAQRDGRLDFNRPPRVNPPVAPFKRDLPSPPSRGRKARLPLAASLVPLGAGLLLFVLLKSPVMLAIAGLSPLMAISTYVSDRRGGRKSFARDAAAFQAELENALLELNDALAEEATIRRAEAPDAPNLLARLGDLAPSLWERRPADGDFLCLRVGVADLPARSSLGIQDGGDPELRAQAQEKLSKRSTVRSVPLTLDLRRAGVVGLTGARSTATGLARWLVLQAAILHSPGELVLMAALTPATAQEWSWLKWLPHVRPDRVGLQSPAIAVGRPQAESLLAEIRDLLRQRRAQARAQAGSPRPAQLVLLIDEDTEVDRAIVSAALADMDDLGVAVVWLGRDARNLPGQTGAIVEVQEGTRRARRDRRGEWGGDGRRQRRGHATRSRSPDGPAAGSRAGHQRARASG